MAAGRSVSAPDLGGHPGRRLPPVGAGHLREYGSPFYTVTRYFEYNFSWTVHHYDKGNTLASQFYTRANLPEIARVKLKSLFIIAVHTTMIVGLPLILGFCRRLGTARGAGT